MELNRKSLKKMFPNLTKEMESNENKVDIGSVRTGQTEEKRASNRFASYEPGVIDFIRRCDNESQAEEIIAYLEKRGEMSKQNAQQLREQLREKGIRSFGSKKEADYYLKHGEQ